jgi:hypothetical protein
MALLAAVIALPGPVLWLGIVLAVVLMILVLRGNRRAVERDPAPLRTFVTFHATVSETSDPGSVLFARILAELPPEIEVPAEQSTEIERTGSTSVGVRVGDWKADVFFGKSDESVWTLFVEPQELVDSPALRTLLRSLDRAITSRPEISQVEWYKREAPDLVGRSPVDE